ncbi:MAG TPA: hypothetical protein PLQ44_03735 [Candidatus Paceibacterota bacterium]|nr:hypothetical protein [Candidatus Paceibacterota bacterium]
MTTLVIEYDGKKIEKQINDSQFGAYNNSYRKEIEKYFKNKLGITKEIEDLSTDMITLFDVEKDAAINSAQELTERLRLAMRTINIYRK